MTPDRAAVLELAIQGLRTAEIAAVLGRPDSAVTRLLHGMREDTGTSSTGALVFMALRRGWYTIDPLPFEQARRKS